MVLSGPESLMSFRAGLGVNLGVLGGPGGRICGALAEAEQMPQVGSTITALTPEMVARDFK